MSRFALRYPYFILVACLMVCVVGATSVARMPVDLFPPIKIPVVVVATFFSGMPPEQVENDITGRFERFFTLGSGIDHIESRSLPGVSLIKVYFQPGTNADSAVTTIANLAMADLRKLPPGTLPPVVLKFDASSLPVCLITLKGEGMNEATLRDVGQYNVRNQVANVPGASVPQPFGGRYRQIMVYVDPLKLEAHQLSVMDVVRTVNEANLILPAGDVKIGPYDYNLYVNSQVDDVRDINELPLKTVGAASVLVGDVGRAQDASQIQNNIVRVDGQPSVYLPVMKQGGDANTIAVVDGIKDAVAHLLDVPKQLVAKVVFDQSIFVRNAIENLIDEGAIGLVLTGIMILVFLGSMRATLAVFLSIPLSALAAFMALDLGGNTINTMVLGGLALAFSRLIDNSVVVLENIFRHLELGEPPEVAARKGGEEVALAVLAATLTTAVVFFPVVFLYGVSRYLFTALALSVVLSLFASYVVAMTVVPLFCAKLIRHHGEAAPGGKGFNAWFNRRFHALLDRYDGTLKRSLLRPLATVLGITGFFVLSLAVYPFIGKAYFPRTDPSQFVINLKAPTGTRIENTDKLIARVEGIVRQVVPPQDLRIVVSNIGVTPGFASMYTPNSGPHTAFVQVGLQPGHKRSSFQYMDLVRARLQRDLPELSSYFQTGGLVDAVLNLGLPAPIDVQVSGSNLEAAHAAAVTLARKIRGLRGVSDVLVPQDVDYPSLRLDIDRVRAGELGLSEKEVVGNIITALTSDQMIAPSYWVDPKSGNDYLLTVQYPEGYVKNLADLGSVPLRGPKSAMPTQLDAVSRISRLESPTEVDHYQLRRVIDIYVSPAKEDLSTVASGVQKLIAGTELPPNVRIAVRGSVGAMQTSFKSFGLGLILATLLVYLILVAQFRSFIDPLLILLAVPTGLTGVLLILWLTGTTLNVMSLMGVVMMVGIVVSNSILIVEFTHRLLEQGLELREAVAVGCRVRLRPVLMTSLATLIGLIPMSLALGAGSEAYAPLARAIIGGLAVSVVLTMYIVPAAFYLVYRRRPGPPAPTPPPAPPPEVSAPDAPLPPMRSAVRLGLFCLLAAGAAAAEPPPPPSPLTLAAARDLALRYHPRALAAQLRAEGAQALVAEARAAYLPSANAYLTAVDAGNENTRILAGGLNNPSIYDRAAGGLAITQLLTDFGRTSNLTAGSKLEARAEGQNAAATREQLLLEVDLSFFNALQAQAVLKVADQTLQARRYLVDQISALAQNKLKSSLDVSFSQVALEEAELLRQRAAGDEEAAEAALSADLGYGTEQHFELADPAAPPAALPDLAAALEAAHRDRPDLARLRYERDAARRFSRAENDLNGPTVTATGMVGDAAWRDSHLPEHYAAGGVNLNFPIFTGGLYAARQHAARIKADIADQALREAEDDADRDVRVAWVNLRTATQRQTTAAQLVRHAQEAYELAQARYQAGSSSIVELSQAEVEQTSAEIGLAGARYGLLAARAALDYQTGARP